MHHLTRSITAVFVSLLGLRRGTAIFAINYVTKYPITSLHKPDSTCKALLIKVLRIIKISLYAILTPKLNIQSIRLVIIKAFPPVGLNHIAPHVVRSHRILSAPFPASKF